MTNFLAPAADRITKPAAIIDFEITKPIKLLGLTYITTFQNVKEGSIHIYNLHNPEHLSIIQEIINYTLIGHNINAYDIYILDELYKQSLTKTYNLDKLHKLSEELIKSNQRPKLNRTYTTIDTFILYQIFIHSHSGSPQYYKHCGLKSYMAVKGLSIKEIDWETLNQLQTARQETIDELTEYLKNDIVATKKLFNEPYIQSRIKLVTDINQKYLYYADHEIARDIMSQWTQPILKTQELTEDKLVFPKLKPILSPELLDFAIQAYQDKNTKLNLNINNFLVTLGIGGIHGKKMNVATEKPSTKYIYLNIDFASFYPNLYTQLGIFKESIENELKNYIYRRLQLKHSTTQEDIVTCNSIKIVLNSLYGLLNHINPAALRKITINGQLILFTLLEKLLKHNYDVMIVNTDGLDIRIPNTKSSHKQTDKINKIFSRILQKIGFTCKIEINKYNLAYYENSNSIAYYGKQRNTIFDQDKSSKDFRLSKQQHRRFTTPIASIKLLINTLFTLKPPTTNPLQIQIIDYFVITDNQDKLGYILINEDTKEEKIIKQNIIRYYYSKQKYKLFRRTSTKNLSIASEYYVNIFNDDLNTFNPEDIDLEQYNYQVKQRLNKNQYQKILNLNILNLAIEYTTKLALYLVPGFYKTLLTCSKKLPLYTDNPQTYLEKTIENGMYTTHYNKEINSLTLLTFKHIILDIDDLSLIPNDLIELLESYQTLTCISQPNKSLKYIFNVGYRYIAHNIKEATLYNKGIEYICTRTIKVQQATILGSYSEDQTYQLKHNTHIATIDAKLAKILNLTILNYRSLEKQTTTTDHDDILEYLETYGFKFTYNSTNLWISHCIIKEPENKTKVSLAFEQETKTYKIFCKHSKCAPIYQKLQYEITLGFQPTINFEKQTLENIQLQPGGTLIMGPTGSGKTTYIIQTAINLAPKYKVFILAHSHKQVTFLYNSLHDKTPTTKFIPRYSTEERLYKQLFNSLTKYKVIVTLYHYFCKRGIDHEYYILGRLFNNPKAIHKLKTSLGTDFVTIIDEIHIPLREMRKIITINRPMIGDKYLISSQRINRNTYKQLRIERDITFLEEEQHYNLENKYFTQEGSKSKLLLTYPELTKQNASYVENTFLVYDLEEYISNREEPENLNQHSKLIRYLEQNNYQALLTRHLPYIEHRDKTKTYLSSADELISKYEENYSAQKQKKTYKLVVPKRPFLVELIFEVDIGIVNILKHSKIIIMSTATLSLREIELLEQLCYTANTLLRKIHILSTLKLKHLIVDFYKSNILSYDKVNITAHDAIKTIFLALKEHNKEILFFMANKEEAHEQYQALTELFGEHLALLTNKEEKGIFGREYNTKSKVYVSHLRGIFAVGVNLPNNLLLTVTMEAHLPRASTAQRTLIETKLNITNTLHNALIQAIGRNARLSRPDDTYQTRSLIIYSCNEKQTKLLKLKLRKTLYTMYEKVTEEVSPSIITFNAFMYRMKDLLHDCIGNSSHPKRTNDSYTKYIIQSFVDLKRKITRSDITKQHPNICLTEDNIKEIITKVNSEPNT